MTRARDENLQTSEGPLPLTVVEGEGAGPAVVVVPSIFGVTSDLVAQTRDIAESAPYAVALDPFFRTEPGPLPYDEPDRAKARMRATDQEAVYRDVLAIIDHARGQSNGNVIALGICFGGPFCFRAAAAGAVDGVVVWHGTGLENHLDLAASISCPIRLHFGDSDPVVPPEAVADVRDAFAAHHDVDIVVHPGATHGFSHRAATAYDPAAERAALNATRDLAHTLWGQLFGDRIYPGNHPNLPGFSRRTHRPPASNQRNPSAIGRNFAAFPNR